ncbi:transposase, partial [candidate division KSB1 bacterium]|nr:transposase [candidate division KSB1 bacterium]
MPNYKRIYIPGAQYFFTVVTYNRQPILTNQTARELLREAILNVKDNHPFEINAICLLPDHLHCIWTLPPDDFDYSLRWRLLK